MRCLVNRDRCFLRRGLHQTESLSVWAVEPKRENLNPVLILNGEILLVSSLDVILGDITQILVNIHKDRHLVILSGGRSQGSGLAAKPYI